MNQQIKQEKSEDLNTAYRSYCGNPSDESLAFLLKAAYPMIKHFAYLLSGGSCKEDEIQLGYEGVLKAVKNYNKNYGAAFSTYAGHCIIGEIRHYIRKEMRFYKPRFLVSLQEKAQRLTQEYYEKNGTIPSNTQLAQALNVKEEGVAEIFRVGLVSFEQLELDKINSLRYESFRLPVEDKIVLYEAIQKLSDIKRKVILSLFFKNRTQQQTADSLGINQRKVSRLLKSGLVDLREYLAELK